TDLGLIWKDSGDFFFHAFSLSSGAPAPGATVKLLDEEGKTLASTTIGADGTAHLPKLKQAKEGEEAPGPKWLVLSAGGDQLTLNFETRNAMEFGRFRINIYGDEEDIVSEDLVESGKQRGLVFTDR